ncbi:MAG: MATE family efflux transporter [Cellulosilyticaceae bacterium]
MNKATIYQKPVRLISILAITIPTIFMTLIQASYSMIDGMFISNILGDEALSALTLISPYFNLFIAIGALFASGGSAVVMKKMGENKSDEARQDFTTLIVISLIVGFVLSTVFLVFTGPLVSLFSHTLSIRALCREYLCTYSFFVIPQILFAGLQIYTIGSGKASLAMGSSLLGGIINILCDFLMIKVLGMGMMGAALASGLGMLVPCMMLIINFMNSKNLLHFSKLRFDGKVLAAAMSNGVSEFASNLVSGVVIMLFNGRMLAIAGASGVAASTITFYVFGLMSALYMGYMLGISPLLSYFYGANETAKLQKIRKISLTFISIVAVVTTVLANMGSSWLVGAFTAQGTSAYELAINGNKLFSLALLFVGFNTFASMLFTALSNGKVSAIIAFSRTFVFLCGAILLLPSLWGINGLWLAVPVSELLACILAGYYIVKYKKQYHY